MVEYSFLNMKMYQKETHNTMTLFAFGEENK